jgi:hypothetical protein
MPLVTGGVAMPAERVLLIMAEALFSNGAIAWVAGGGRLVQRFRETVEFRLVPTQGPRQSCA